MMFQVGDDGVVSSVNEEDLIHVDKNELDKFVESYHKLEEENEELKQKIKSISEILTEDIGYIESLRKIEEVLK